MGVSRNQGYLFWGEVPIIIKDEGLVFRSYTGVPLLREMAILCRAPHQLA